MTRRRNEAIAGRPFSLELDVYRYDHDTDKDVTVDISTATSVYVRIVSPAGTSVDNVATVPTSPNYRVKYDGDGTEIPTEGQWGAIVLYTLPGDPQRESFRAEFTVRKASPTPP